MMSSRDDVQLGMLRRSRVLKMLAAFGSSILAGCGGGGSSSTVPTTAATTTATTTTTSSSCAETVEGEIGPYFADDSAAGFNRSNILTNIDGTSAQAGIPLTLNVQVYDSEKSCAAVAGAQVDIWQCNAEGVYSDESSESTTGTSWLRGYQLTSASGVVTFTTIVPGWYAGRTTHIHLRVRSAYSEASSTNDGTIDAINSSVAPYSQHGTDPTTNANDHVYTPETKGTTLLSIAGDTASGYTATFSVGLPITA